jgi:hypothetical protein
MKRQVFRLAIIESMFVMFLAVTATAVYAIDSGGRYFAYGVGQKSCEDYITFREKRLEALENHERYTKDQLYEIVDKIVEHWIAGFVTAHNYYVVDTYDVVGKITMEDMKSRLEKICRANPKEHVAEAIIVLVQELNPQRVKADPGK